MPTALTEADAQALCREFARVYPTREVRRAVALAEADVLTWSQVAWVFANAAAAAFVKIEVERQARQN
jgi:hypothetical protein